MRSRRVEVLSNAADAGSNVFNDDTNTTDYIYRIIHERRGELEKL
jgi:hypothetical protein